MANYDLDRIRAQFPGLARLHDGQQAVFFDNPAGTQVARQVIDRMVHAMTHCNANLGGFFDTSVDARTLVDEAHAAAADFVNSPDPGEVMFGQNMTTVTFAVSRSIGRDLRAGDEIVLTRMDHDGNVTPWLMLAEDRGLTVRWLDFDPDRFEFKVADLEGLLTDRTRVVALNYASNVTGTINDVKALTRVAKRAGALVYVDAVQFAPHGVIDVQDLGCDFLICSAYKFYGPHYGLLWGRREVLERLQAYKVRAASSELPFKFVTGTTNREELAGIRGAVEYFEWVGQTFGDTSATNGTGSTRRQHIVAGVAAMHAHEATLIERFLQGVAEIQGVRVLGLTNPPDLHRRVPTFSLDVQNHDPESVARAMAARGIHVWQGHFYGVEPVTRLGLLEKGGVVRVGPTHYNTIAEVDRFHDALQDHVHGKTERAVS